MVASETRGMTGVIEQTEMIKLNFKLRKSQQLRSSKLR